MAKQIYIKTYQHHKELFVISERTKNKEVKSFEKTGFEVKENDESILIISPYDGAVVKYIKTFVL